MRRGDHVRLEDRLGPDEPPYKSRGEAQIGRLLNRHGIPFAYEQPTVVYDRGRRYVLYPDFTLPGYDGLIVEYAGMPDRPEYMARIRFKRHVYAANDMPALFVYPSHLRGRHWPQRLISRIHHATDSAVSARIGYRR